jgi:8-oxo-dGTP diphosphatase
MGATRNSIAGIAVENGLVFIARRLPGGDLGGKWEFPGGKVEDGESDAEALIREYNEEFGVVVEVGPLLGTAAFEHHGIGRTLRAYRVRFVSHDFHLAEHTEWDWVPLEAIGGLDFADSDRSLIPELKEHLS